MSKNLGMSVQVSRYCTVILKGKTYLGKHALLGQIKNRTRLTKIDEVNVFETDGPKFGKCEADNQGDGKYQRYYKLDRVPDCSCVVNNNCHQSCCYGNSDGVDQVDHGFQEKI